MAFRHDTNGRPLSQAFDYFESSKQSWSGAYQVLECGAQPSVSGELIKEKMARESPAKL